MSWALRTARRTTNHFAKIKPDYKSFRGNQIFTYSAFTETGQWMITCVHARCWQGWAKMCTIETFSQKISIHLHMIYILIIYISLHLFLQPNLLSFRKHASGEDDRDLHVTFLQLKEQVTQEWRLSLDLLIPMLMESQTKFHSPHNFSHSFTAKQPCSALLKRWSSWEQLQHNPVFGSQNDLKKHYSHPWQVIEQPFEMGWMPTLLA